MLFIALLFLSFVAVHGNDAINADATPVPPIVTSFEAVAQTCFKEAAEGDGGFIRKCRAGMQCVVENVDNEWAASIKLNVDKFQARVDEAKKDLDADLLRARQASQDIDTKTAEAVMALTDAQKTLVERVCASITDNETHCLELGEDKLRIALLCKYNLFRTSCGERKVKNGNCDDIVCADVQTKWDATKEAVQKVSVALNDRAAEIRRSHTEAKATIIEKAKERLAEFTEKVAAVVAKVRKGLAAIKAEIMLTPEQEAKLATFKTRVKALADECKADRTLEKCKLLPRIRRHVLRMLARWWKVSVGVRCVRRAKKVILARVVEACSCKEDDTETCLRRVYNILSVKMDEFCAKNPTRCTDELKAFIRNIAVRIIKMELNSDGECVVEAETTVPETNIEEDADPEAAVNKREVAEDTGSAAEAINFMNDSLDASEEGISASIVESDYGNAPEEVFIECAAESGIEGLCTDDAELANDATTVSENPETLPTPATAASTESTASTESQEPDNTDPSEMEEGNSASAFTSAIAMLLAVAFTL